jgi:hypothetical protein
MTRETYWTVDHNRKVGASGDICTVGRRSNGYTLRSGRGDQKSDQGDDIEKLHRCSLQRWLGKASELRLLRNSSFESCRLIYIGQWDKHQEFRMDETRDGKAVCQCMALRQLIVKNLDETNKHVITTLSGLNANSGTVDRVPT